MDVASVFGSVGSTARNHGLWPACYDVSFRLLNKAIYYRDMQCFIADAVQAKSLQLPPHLRFTRLEEDALLEFAKDPKHELDSGFIRRTLIKGDECYGIL